MSIITEASGSLSRDTATHTPASSISMSSPATSVFSRGHSSKGSGSNSSLASSPLPRDSFDLYASRLGKVTEEPQEREDFDSRSLVDASMDTEDSYDRYFDSYPMQTSPTSSPIMPGYNFADQEEYDHSSSQRYFKRQRSSDTSSSVGNRLSSRFSSISRRWRNRSGAGPQLSVITHVSAPTSLSGSGPSSQIMSPALSAISRHESYLPPSPTRTNLDDSVHGSDALSIPETPPQGEEPAQAATPLLPPVFTELAKKDGPVHSPLQSPAIAPTQVGLNERISMDVPALASLPSPPLSTRPSMVSIRQRSRANTATGPPLGEVPVLQMLDEHDDAWASQLGHADFSIHPEPYLPGVVDLDSYTEFRANWHQARTNYTKHLARTIEHYGPTSRVFKLTEEKWAYIDKSWKKHNDALSQMLAPLLARNNERDADMKDSLPTDAVLRKPVTRIVIPAMEDKSGKFPELGDGDIVGPMEVGPPRAASMSKSSPPLSPLSPTRKRNLFKFLQDMFARS